MQTAIIYAVSMLVVLFFNERANRQLRNNPANRRMRIHKWLWDIILLLGVAIAVVIIAQSGELR